MIVKIIKCTLNIATINTIINDTSLQIVAGKIQAPAARINPLEQCTYISSNFWHCSTKSLGKNTRAHNSLDKKIGEQKSLDETAGEYKSLAKVTYNTLAEIIQHVTHITAAVRNFMAATDMPRSEMSLRLSDPASNS